MKKLLLHNINSLRLLTLLVVMGSLLAACTQEEDLLPPTVQGDYISLYSKISSSQKARLAANSFEANESIGLYVVPFESDGYTPGQISNTTYAVNKQHIFNGSSWLLESGGKVAWPNTTAKVDLYAYYPYSKSLNEQDPTAYSFAVNSDQHTKAGYDASDFLWSKTESVTPTSDAVGLSFSHKLSKVKINIKTDLDVLAEPLSQAAVSILNTKQVGIINLADGNIVSVEPSVLAEIKTLQVATTPGYEITLEGIVIPQTLAKSAPFIGIELEYNGAIRYSYAPTDNVTLEAGKERAFNITITKMGISVTVDNIKDWEPTEPIEGEIATPAPMILDISTIDWSKSLVHNVYNKGFQVAEVAKEYIFKNGTVDYQAIVVYPIGLDGEVDLTNGFIAQVMNRARNSSTNEYEANTSSVHGGKVSFAKSNNSLQSYTAGKGALSSKVEVVSSSEIKAASNDAITILTTEPELLTDVDGNTYPLVKIGTQYWIRENLKVEHYKDGSDLTYYYYNDNRDNKHKYGAYYTWPTVMNSKGIAPDGWRVPSSDDFISLYQYLTPDAGMKLKANTMWIVLTYNDDVTGFSGLPTGRRTDGGVYNELNYYGQWWTSTISGTSAYRLYLDYGNRAMQHVILLQTYTQSVRLLRE